MRAQVKKPEKIEAVLTFVQNIVSVGNGAILGVCPCPFFFFFCILLFFCFFTGTWSDGGIMRTYAESPELSKVLELATICRSD